MLFGHKDVVSYSFSINTDLMRCNFMHLCRGNAATEELGK